MSCPNDDFMNFMGYRNMLLEERIEECLEAIRRGESSISIDAGDLTENELYYLERELQRRLG